MKFKELSEILMTEEFSEKELKQIQAIADVRLGNFSARQDALNEAQGTISDTYVLLFYDRLKTILESECDLHILPLHVIRKRQQKVYKEIEKATAFLYSVSERWNLDKSRTRNFAIGIFNLYCKLVIEYLRQIKVPISLKTSLQHTDKFVGLVDMAFPGYVESGMIKVVILGEKGREAFGKEA